MNRGILTPHLLPTLTSTNSTYITDLIDIQDKVLDAAIGSLQKCDDKYQKSTQGVTVFPIGSYVLVKQEHPPTEAYRLADEDAPEHTDEFYAILFITALNSN